MNLLDKGLARHQARLCENAGGLAVYCRGSYRIELQVVPGSSTMQDVQTGNDYTSEIKSVDFLILPDELKLGGDMLEPQRGDRVEWDGMTFCVLSGGMGAAWSWSDSRRVFYRVHTVRQER